mmetsp:Transcript_31505/g.28698  ORF Transcript_31505/g.28698 Transcript_31505/m.28698 type:complete len:135 (+) Transcript_31505:53-457(+)
MMEPPSVGEHDFTTQDKQKVLEIFLQNETVAKVTKYLMFWSNDKKDQTYDTTNNPKSLIEDEDMSLFTNLLNDTSMHVAETTNRSPSPDYTSLRLPNLQEKKAATMNEKGGGGIDSTLNSRPGGGGGGGLSNLL